MEIFNSIHVRRLFSPLFNTIRWRELYLIGNLATLLVITFFLNIREHFLCLKTFKPHYHYVLNPINGSAKLAMTLYQKVYFYLYGRKKRVGIHIVNFILRFTC